MVASPARTSRLIAVARGLAPADVILANARIVNTLSGEIERGDIAVYGGRIAGIGPYRRAKKVIDLAGKYIIPGLINGHTHIESSMLDVGQYARAVVPHGTLAVVTDLHEIANVAGLEGIRYVLDSSRRLPLDFFLMAPSCVPATHLETSGAVIGVAEIRRILKWRQCRGLGEVMNYPGVLAADPILLSKIAAARQKIIDGHAPGLGGNDLQAYLAAGIGSDHECVTLVEADEKLRRGMHIMIREGSTEKNLAALLPLVNDKTYRRCFFVTDDRHAADILHDGDIDAVVRQAIRSGLDPIRVVQLATINTARYFRLEGLGAVAPGYWANLLVLEDLASLVIDMVFYRGHLVAQGGRPLFEAPALSEGRLTSTVKIRPFDRQVLALISGSAEYPVIEVVPGQIITRKRLLPVNMENGRIVADVANDVLKAAVFERHHASGNIGVGLVRGFGLKNGALASSIAHDSHNVVAVGTSDEDIIAAVKEIERMQGGLAVVAGGRVLASLATPVAGLLSRQPLEDVVTGQERLEAAARGLGVSLPSPFAVLSFLALPVIPEIRLTDLGLVDVNEFRLLK